MLPTISADETDYPNVNAFDLFAEKKLVNLNLSIEF